MSLLGCVLMLLCAVSRCGGTQSDLSRLFLIQSENKTEHCMGVSVSPHWVIAGDCGGLGADNATLKDLKRGETWKSDKLMAVNVTEAKGHKVILIRVKESLGEPAPLSRIPASTHYQCKVCSLHWIDEESLKPMVGRVFLVHADLCNSTVKNSLPTSIVFCGVLRPIQGKILKGAVILCDGFILGTAMGEDIYNHSLPGGNQAEVRKFIWTPGLSPSLIKAIPDLPPLQLKNASKANTPSAISIYLIIIMFFSINLYK